MGMCWSESRYHHGISSVGSNTSPIVPVCKSAFNIDPVPGRFASKTFSLNLEGVRSSRFALWRKENMLGSRAHSVKSKSVKRTAGCVSEHGTQGTAGGCDAFSYEQTV